MFKVKETFSQMKHRLSTAKGKAVVVVGGALTLGVTNAMAAFDGSTFAPSVAPLEAVGVAILTVLGIVWVIKRTVGLASK